MNFYLEQIDMTDMNIIKSLRSKNNEYSMESDKLYKQASTITKSDSVDMTSQHSNSYKFTDDRDSQSMDIVQAPQFSYYETEELGTLTQPDSPRETKRVAQEILQNPYRKMMQERPKFDFNQNQNDCVRCNSLSTESVR
jgi:hypothetical protein